MRAPEKQPFSAAELNKLRSLHGHLLSGCDEEANKARKVIREMLESHGYHMSDLISLIETDPKARDKAVADRVIMDIDEKFADTSGNPWVTVRRSEPVPHREVIGIDSPAIDTFLRARFYRMTKELFGVGLSMANSAVKEAIATLRAQALYDEAGAKHAVHLRVGADGEELYVDLVNDQWQAVKVTAQGWSVVDEPLYFHRTKAMQPLPIPERGGSIADLRPFVNLKDDDFVMFVGALLNAMRAQPTYVVTYWVDFPGQAKSTGTKVARSLVDPHVQPVCAPPDKALDLIVVALHQYCICHDNLRTLTPKMSDQYCRLATGVGFARRRLYTTQDVEIIPEMARPLFLNGKASFIREGDLLDRVVAFFPQRLESIVPEREFWRNSMLHDRRSWAPCSTLW